jgi:hypothetical protein
MKAAAQFGFAIVLALVLFCTPIGACMSAMPAANGHSHPCCPTEKAPLPDDCARPGCVYMDTHVVAYVASPAAVDGLWAELPATILDTRPVAAPVFATAAPPTLPQRRSVLFHQFLN